MTRRVSDAEINALYARCLEHQQAGRLASAEKLYLKLLKLLPNEPELVRGFAILRSQQGKHGQAIEILERARIRHPRSASIEFSLGKILLEMRRAAEAEPRLRACLALSPDFAEAVANLGAALFLLGRYREATIYLKRAVELLPSSVGPLANLASTLLFLNEYSAAEPVLQRALELNPNDHELRLSLAQAQYRNKKTMEAIATYQELLDVHPNHLLALGGLLRAELRICDWSKLEAHRRAFIATLEGAHGQGSHNKPSPYTALLVCDDPSDCLAAASARSRSLSNQQRLNLKPRTGSKRDKIKVAYLSADFRQHATSYLISELIESHDRSAFEIIGLSFGPNISSPMRQRMENAFDVFEDVTELSPSAIAQRLAELSVDIAVDLQGFNQHNRMEIFSYHAVPVQVLYLGWPGTSGAPFYDYVLADPIVLPKENFEHFSEMPVWLPHCYQPNDNKRKVALETPSRTGCGLPEEGFIFCCFNNTFKILPEIFDVWMRLLRQVPGSVLWLLEADQACRKNLVREAAARGIEETRLIFAPRLPNDQHLARLAKADLFLDTIPYNAHTTASDALWQGVPVVTCTGRTFASRVATSLLHNVGLPELAVPSLADYEALALRLAEEPGLVETLKKQLLARRSTAPLFDTGRLARDIEKAYREMVRRADHGLAPDFFDVRTLPTNGSRTD